MGFPAGAVRYNENSVINAYMTPAGRLSVAVFQRAALDWRMLIRKKAWRKPPQPGNSFQELRCFFRSRRAQMLSGCCEGLTPERMLQLLEDELAEAMAEDGRRTPHP